MIGLFRVEIDRRLGLLDRLHGSGARHTAAGTCHALQQVAGIFPRNGGTEHFAALPQAFGAGHLDFPVRMPRLDDIHHRLSHAA